MMHGVGDQSRSNVLTNIVAVRINYYYWCLSKKITHENAQKMCFVREDQWDMNAIIEQLMTMCGWAFKVDCCGG